LIVNGRALMARNAILLSKLVNRGVTEKDIEENMTVISKGRPDMEAKTVLALLHNTDADPELESLLCEVIGADKIEAIRSQTPVTFHVTQVSSIEREEMIAKVSNGAEKLFLKPVTDSGTRGIVTPDSVEEIAMLLGKPKLLKNFVAQKAVSIAFRTMVSQDVIRGDIRQDTVNTRITLHIDSRGAIIEASAVCSPDKHLAHGGVTSIITSVE
jgi:predicted ATP-grasp superfamily ATP-dependent carboligase